MYRITTSSRTTVEVSAAVAWRLLGDYENDPRWRKGVSRMDATPRGPIVAGTRATEELRMLGRTIVTDIEVTEVDAEWGFTWRAVAGATARGTRRVSALGSDRCELITEKEVELTGGDALLGPLVQAVTARTERGDVRRAAALIAALSDPSGQASVTSPE